MAEDPKDQAKAMLERGVSVRAVADLTGVSRTVIGRLRKELVDAGRVPGQAQPAPRPVEASAPRSAPARGRLADEPPDMPLAVIGPTDQRCDICEDGQCRQLCPGAAWDAFVARCGHALRRAAATAGIALHFAAGGGVSAEQLAEWRQVGANDLAAGLVTTPCARLEAEWRTSDAAGVDAALEAADADIKAGRATSAGVRALERRVPAALDGPMSITPQGKLANLLGQLHAARQARNGDADSASR